MTRIFKSKIFWVIAIFVIIGGVVLANFLISSQQVEYITQAVEKGNIFQTVSATGQVKSSADINLNFKTVGRLDVLNVKVGDSVSLDQILAQLRLTDFIIDVNRARADLQEANANLNKILAGSTPEDIAISQVEVEAAKIGLANAQQDLVNTQIIYSQGLDNDEQSLLADIKSALNKASISFQEVDDTLNYEGNANNFSTTNFSLEIAVESGYSNGIEKLSLANSAHSQAQANPTDSSIDNASQAALEALTLVQGTVADLSKLLDFVITSSIISESDLDALKTAINKELTITDASIISVQDAKQELLDARIGLQTKVNEAQNDIMAAEKALEKSQADLDFKTAPSRPEDVDLARAKVAQDQADMAKAQEKLADATLRSPQSGTVISVNYEVGEQISLTTPVVEIEIDDNYKIEVDIPESDIAKIEVGDQVEVTLDAFTEEDIFSALVISVDPAETKIQDVIYFRVSVILDEDQPENINVLRDKIKSGMTANITIKTAEIANALTIPFRAVKEINGQKVVDILEDGESKQVPVNLGLRGDEGNVEIISGLSIGQEVITFVNESR